MVNTRSNSRMEGNIPTSTATTTASVTTRPVMSTGAIPRRVNTTVVEREAEEEFEASGGSISGHSTIVTPSFSSISARGVIDAFQQGNVPLREPAKRNTQNEGKQEGRSLTHDDLRNFEDRLLNLIPRLIQQNLNSHQQPRNNEPQYRESDFSLPDLSQPPPTISNEPPQQLQIQQWPNNTFNPNNSNYNRGMPYRTEAPYRAEAQFQPIRHSQSQPLTTNLGLRIDKWGITFDGTNKTTSIEDFVFRVETLQADFGCEWKDVLKSFHHLLSGVARDWFWDHRRFHNVSKWRDLKAALIAQFHRFDSDFDIQRKILDRRQSSQESFDDFYNAVIKLRNQLHSPLGERDLVNIMRGNLKAPMAQLLFSAQVTGLAQFAKECRRAENLLNSQRQLSARYPARSVHAMEYDPMMSENGPEIDAISRSGKLRCWNCKVEGHMFMDCPEEKRMLFCYKCGREDTVTPRCPVCQGNSGGNVTHFGIEARSKTHYPKQQNQQ